MVTFSRFETAVKPLIALYPEIARLWETKTDRWNATGLLLLTPTDPNPLDLAERVRALWERENPSAPLDRSGAVTKFQKMTALSKERHYWLHGGQLSEDQQAFLWEHVHKLRSVDHLASFDHIADISGLPVAAFRSHMNAGFKE